MIVPAMPVGRAAEVPNRRADRRRNRGGIVGHLYDSTQRSRPASCESQDTLGAEVVDIAEVDEYDEPLQIPGQTTEVPSKAVTLRIEYEVPGLDDTQTETATLHAVAEEGEWHFVLTNEDFEAYEAGDCPRLNEPLNS